MNYKTYRNKCIKLAFFLLLLFYPSVSKNILSVFNCEEIGEKWYLMRDRQVQCFTESWFANATVALIGVGVWVFGIPILFWAFLYRARHKHVNARMKMLRLPKYARLRERWIRELRQDFFAHGKHWDPKLVKANEEELLLDYMKRKNLSVSTEKSRTMIEVFILDVGFRRRGPPWIHLSFM